MLTQAGNPAPMAHLATGDGPAPRGGTAGGPRAGTAVAELTAASPFRRAMAGPTAGETRAPLGGTAGWPLAGERAAAITAASPLGRRPDRPARVGDVADTPLGAPSAGTATAELTAASPFRRARDRQAMAGDATIPPLGAPSAGTATARAAAASPFRRASTDAATVRPSPALYRWRRHGERGDRCRPSAPIARDDPRFARLPYGDGTVHRFGCGAPTGESVTLAVGLLRSAGWRVHRVGAAMAAHHPSGRRWIVGWRVGERRPAWLDRLPFMPAEQAV